MVEPQPSKLMMRVRFPLPAQQRKAQIMNKIRDIFKVETNFQLLKVNVVFAITGTLSVYFAGIVIDFLGLDPYVLGSFFYWSLRIILLLPVYQFLLIIIGSIFGEFEYFWKIERKMLGRLGIKFSS
jgi:manganese efflux pump family protein